MSRLALPNIHQLDVTGHISDCIYVGDIGLRIHITNMYTFLAHCNACPLFAIYEPPHDKPTPKDDFYTKPDRLVPIVMIKMKCTTTWLFGWIPIPTGSVCSVGDILTIGTLQNYVEFPCERGAVTNPDGGEEPDGCEEDA